ncbi:hypothetical protein Tco_0090923 [Tanacetum coccineum]
MGTPTLVCVRSCPNLVLQLVGPLGAFLYIVSCVMIDHYVALPSFRHCRGVTDWIYVRGVPLLLAFACSRFGALVIGPRGGNDERVDELNGQGNDQGLGANGGVEGVNGNVEGVNRGVGGAPDFSTIIAQQLQNLLPAILAQTAVGHCVLLIEDCVLPRGDSVHFISWLRFVSRIDCVLSKDTA